MTEESLSIMSKVSTKDKIIDTALSEASEMSWQYVSLKDIALKADMSLSEVQEYFDDKNDILSGYGKRLDHKMLKNVEGNVDLNAPVKERLFDVLMERFDLLNDDREAVVSILSSFKLDPKNAAIAFPHLCKSMNWVLESVGEDTNGFKGGIKILGLTGLYLKALKDWLEDDSQDMAKTMASLDKGLTHCERVTGYLSL